MRKRSLLAIVTVAAMTGTALTVAVAQYTSADGVQAHLQELQNIAEANGGNRASGEPGYKAALDYVKSELDEAGFQTSVQQFDAPIAGRTFNLIAETKGGDPNNVVVVGAHLDSVHESAGINDNGTGVAAVLQSALDWADSGDTARNKLRFAFWGAEEEEGLVGSTHYVDGLSQRDRDKIAMYLNFDMVGSHNAGYFTYDGDYSDEVGDHAPDGSAEIEKQLNTSFEKAGISPEGTDFDGSSDYHPFIEAGIASGGTFTGADGTMSREQAEKWDGVAGQPFDGCYHTECDTLENVNHDAVATNLQVINDAVRTFAQRPL